jgi:hypothetical protein
MLMNEDNQAKEGDVCFATWIEHIDRVAHTEELNETTQSIRTRLLSCLVTYTMSAENQSVRLAAKTIGV